MTKKDHVATSEVSDCLLKEDNERLKRAIQKGNLQEVSAACWKAMSLCMELSGKDLKWKLFKKTVKKRKNSLIAAFFGKKTKKKS